MIAQPIGGVRRAAAAALVVGLLVSAVPGTAVQPDPGVQELLVTTRSADAADDLAQRVERPGARGNVQRLSDRVLLVRSDAADRRAADLLAATQGVVAVEPNTPRPFLSIPDDPTFPEQWTHRQANVESAWAHYTGGEVTVAVIDSGVDATHPDLADAVVAQRVVSGGRVRAGQPQNDECRFGHGTAVAGVIGATGDNGRGVSGVVWDLDLIDVAVSAEASECVGGAFDADVVAAVAHLTDLPLDATDGPSRPDVINMSFGLAAEACPTAFEAVFADARAAGITLVAGAGNDGGEDTVVPASCDGVISVGAVRVDGELASYSQRNAHVDVAAGGGDLTAMFCPHSFEELVAEMVVTTALEATDVPAGTICGEYADPHGERLRAIRGTSFAAPYVAGVAALLRGFSRQLPAFEGTPGLSPDQVEAAIEGTATDAGAPGRDPMFGWGVVDAGAALAAVADGEVDALAPDPGFPAASSRPSRTHCPDGPASGEGWQRVAGTGPAGTTDPVELAIAVSCELPDASAPYAVLARVDAFADALAGSAIGYGIAPILFTAPDATLDRRTEAELLRVLDFSGPIRPSVVVMGGSAAIPEEVEIRLFELGISTTRVAGAGREATAAAAMETVLDLRAAHPLPARNDVFVVFGHDFADAVSAGQMAAHYGIPVLLTNTDPPLHPETRAALRDHPPERAFVVGGAAVVSDAVVEEIASLGIETIRLAGPTRVETALAVAERYLTELRGDGHDAAIGAPVAVNLRTTFADALVGSLLAARGAPFLPLEGPTADASVPELTRGTRAAFCDHGGSGPLILGGPDHVTDQAAEAVVNLLAGASCDAPPSDRS